MRTLFSLCLLGMGLAAGIPPAVANELAQVTPASRIDPAGGAAIKWSNPGWARAFKAEAGGPFAPRSRAEIEKLPGVTVFDFEADNGFGQTPASLQPEGGVFAALEKTAPYALSQKITRITARNGRSVAVECRYFDEATGRLARHPAGGVFLVADRERNDGMTSGRQGLIAGPVRLAYGDTDRGGVHLTFDRALSDFAVTVNASSSESHGPTTIIALFDAAGGLLAKYVLGVKSYEPVYFGVHSAGGDIRSVWVGQRGQLNGLVIDDLAFASAEADGEASLKSQLPVAGEAVAESAPNAYRILFIGDSITRHGTNDDVKRRLGWGHVAGMAASSPEKDYVHLLSARIQETMPDRKVEIYYRGRDKTKNGPNPHRGGTAAAAVHGLDGALSLEPHLFVIQLGEHEEASKGADFVREHYEKLVTFFDGQDARPRVLVAGVWQPGDAAAGRDDYRSGWAGVVERVQREVCEKHGIPFASVREFALDPSCRGWGESPGVRWHPNDKGMDGYARVLFEAYVKGRL